MNKRPDADSYRPRGGYDLSKVRWSSSKHRVQASLSSNIGIYTPNPNIVVRFDDPGTSDPQEIEEMAGHLQIEFQRIRRNGIHVQHVHHQIAPGPPHTDIASSLMLYSITSRLYAEQPSPHASGQVPKLLRLGRSIVSYLDETEEGGWFLADIGPLEQYAYGTPFANRSQPSALYLQDIGPTIQHRGEMEYDGTNILNSAFSDVKLWVSQLPPSGERDALLGRIAILQEPLAATETDFLEEDYQDEPVGEWWDGKYDE